MALRMQVNLGVRVKMFGEVARWRVSLGEYEYDVRELLRAASGVAMKQIRARAKRTLGTLQASY